MNLSLINRQLFKPTLCSHNGYFIHFEYITSFKINNFLDFKPGALCKKNSIGLIFNAAHGYHLLKKTCLQIAWCCQYYFSLNATNSFKLINS